MTVDSAVGNKHTGIYRGVVTKHLPHGRCKIFIPSVYDEEYKDKPDMLPSAQPATPLFAGTNNGNGCFSYPNIGSVVWCFFENEDANFPVFFAATLGGENAFGQYDIVKRNCTKFNDVDVVPEAKSTRHLITSGKTHIEWYENGKLSAIVEDPIRTKCNVDYTQYEKYNDNISAQISNQISNYSISAINLNKLSNIDCQFVMDNNANAHGEISSRTHWYNIISEDKDGNTANGTISIDNSLTVNNDGIIRFGTLSTLELATSKNGNTTNDSNRVKNYYELNVPGQLEEEVHNKIDHSSSENGKSETLSQESKFYRQMNVDTQAVISGKIRLNKTESSSSGSKDITHQLTNDFSMLSSGSIALNTSRHENILDSTSGNSFSKIVNNSGIIKADTYSSAGIKTLSNEVIIDSNTGINNAVRLQNMYVMDADGKIESSSQRIQNKKNSKTGVDIIENGIGAVKFNSTGKHLTQEKYYLQQKSSAGTLVLDNEAKLELNADSESSILLGVKEEKTVDDSPIVNVKYANQINATTSTANIKIIDNISKMEHINNVDVKHGVTEIKLTNKNNGMSCSIKMDANGNMTIDTTSTVSINAPATTVSTEFMSVNTSILDVSCKGDCSIKADSVNFSDKVSVGAGATGTITSTSVVGVVNGIVTQIS